MKIALHFIWPLLLLTGAAYKNTGSLNEKTGVQKKPAELTDLKGIAYASNLKDWKNKPVPELVMDLYFPTGATSDKKYPLILFCHAGGFTGGSRLNVMSISDKFADQGFIVAALDYRTGYSKGTPQNCSADVFTMHNAFYRAVQDAKACLRFLAANADTYNIDTNWIFIAGSSAGATLAMNTAHFDDAAAQQYFPASYDSLGSTETSGNAYPINYTLKGICSMWGSLTSSDSLITASKNFPTILFRGEEDGGTPDSIGHFAYCPNYPIVVAAPAIYARLNSLGKPVVFHYLTNANHPAYDNEFCIKQVACFFRAAMEGRSYSGKFLNYNESCQ